ncbi:hypothetical protein [Phycicoccus flavus]|uniref:hypothetical protein n=1 Tax=Phycicoccus flavus TaxID=2502783 RepID=UPI000FEC0BDE|nr:hypothetical protein [Phycicoccus flavus]NHA67809.1 hypothetical protein [Phycicoccus flavus]
MTRLPLTAAVLAVGLLASGCSEGIDSSADRTVCVGDATALSKTPDGFPADFPFPPGTVVYHGEDRGADGLVITGVTATPFQDVLAALNGPVQDAGFTVTSGETEEHDAEANWEKGDQRGRWAIRESADCPGETVVQVLASSG